jgi:hypothetical protein
VTDSNEAKKLHDKTHGNLTQLLDEVRAQSHVLAEHATIIFTRSELALEQVKEADNPVRRHLTAIHRSAGTVSESSKKLRRLVSA